MTWPPITAALTLSLTGRYERQGTEAAEGVRLWAETAGVRLTLVDDQGSREAAVKAYRGWMESADLLIGPYSSGLVRAIAPLVSDAERVLWNHGGSADDLAQPGIASLPAPASSYFDGVVDEAADRKVSRMMESRTRSSGSSGVHGRMLRASQLAECGYASAVPASTATCSADSTGSAPSAVWSWRAGTIATLWA